jgi:small conductance mechanosensitive channel
MNQMSASEAVESAVDSFWRMWGTPLTVVGIIVGAVLARVILQFVIQRVVDRIVNGFKRRQNIEDTTALNASPLAAARIVQRTRTLGLVLSNIVTTVLVVLALLMILTTLVPNVTGAFALITAALGAGLGFGAQNIIKDVLNGLFMVVEDQLGVGSRISSASATSSISAPPPVWSRTSASASRRSGT